MIYDNNVTTQTVSSDSFDAVEGIGKKSLYLSESTGPSLGRLLKGKSRNCSKLCLITPGLPRKRSCPKLCNTEKLRETVGVGHVQHCSYLPAATVSCVCVREMNYCLATLMEEAKPQRPRLFSSPDLGKPSFMASAFLPRC